MLSMQEMSDRLEIQDLLVRYTYALDGRNWEDFNEVFTPDAIIDYTEVGGDRGTRDEIKLYLAKAMERFPIMQHITVSSEIRISGDTAKTRSILFNPMHYKEGDAEQMIFIGLWYYDDMVRTPEGWRITHRHERAGWHFNTPEGMMPED